MTVLQHHGSIAVLHPTGPLRHDNVEELDDTIRQAIKVGVPRVVIDLSDTALIDGAGLTWILTLDEECCRRGGCVRLCSVGELCGDLLRITSVGSTVQQFENLESALGSFA
jgi:anti-anti-sigma factor